MFYSVIVPVYNRPDHIDGLLSCFVNQTYNNFEVLVVESGSTIKSDEVVEKYKNQLNVSYNPTGNNGQGFSRNFGMTKAKGDYFIILDSDILLDDDFIEQVHLGVTSRGLDAYGGPDKLHPYSDNTQKAVDYLMTSFYTTGGTRGGKTQVGKYYPRSFNMGFSRKVYEATGGFKLPYMGEDMEFSRRVMDLGFKTGLIEKAHVYHERKKTLGTFYKQIHWFGRSRVNIARMFPDTLKAVHFIPLFFCFYLLSIVVTPWVKVPLLSSSSFLLIYLILILVDATKTHKNLLTGIKATAGVFYLMIGYSRGMIEEFLNPSNVNRTEKIS